MFLFKEGLSLIIRRLSFNSDTIFLFSLVSTLKLSKDNEWLQSNKWSLTTLLLGLTVFLVNGEILICSPILSPRWNLWATLVVSPFGMRSLKQKTFVNLFWFLNKICNLQQLRIPLRDVLNLVLVCNDNGRW